MRTASWTVLLLAATFASGAEPARPIRVVVPRGASPRVEFGAARLIDALRSVGYDPMRAAARGSGPAIVIGNPKKDPALARLVRTASPALLDPEGFVLAGLGGGVTAVGATGDTGLLYGCLELEARVRAARSVPPRLAVSDAPRFSLRGPAIGMQRPEITYDGVQYDYLYTRENFPFFYDRAHWTRYLDFLLENRMNTLYLWTGHPFTSLLELPRYPEARELAPEQLRKNIETFTWLTSEADKRGIWVIQKFYNIHISHALAKARNVPIVYSRPTELASAYMRYVVSEFIRSYKHVGFMLCLGEALQDDYDAEWLTGVILTGVKDGMRALGISEEPPIIVRAHSTPIEQVMAAATRVYSNLLTMHKYNGEGLTTPKPRGEVRRLHESLAKLGSAHIVNVHLLSNLEPFRWGATEFIRKSMLSCQRMGAKGLHLYPLRYWDWPVTADVVSPPLLQIDRDWIWFEAWARYAWNPQRESAAERRHWVDRIALRYGSRAAAERILDAYDLSGEVSPRLLPRIGITTGARQTFALGMLMTQLISPARYSPWVEMWEATAPPGERLEEWAKREWEKQPHAGETPPRLADELVQVATRAVADIEAAAPLVTSGHEEFARVRNDVHAIRAIARHYAWKVHAAASVLRYRYSGELADLDRAQELLDRSLEEYRELVRLTGTAYRDANSLHAASRRIPFISGPGLYIHWRQCLPEYEKEAAVFRRNRARLRDPGRTPTLPTNGASDTSASAVSVKAFTLGVEVFTVGQGAALFTDRSYTAAEVAHELHGLTGIRVSAAAAEKGLTVDFEIAEPARILVGFPLGAGHWATPPKDEWDLVLERGVLASRLPPVRVFSHLLPSGRNQVDFGKGGFVILGFVKPGSGVEAGLQGRRLSRNRGDLDWLFEEE